MKQILIKRGDVFWVNFDPATATETQKTRPAVIFSHDLLNEKFSRVIVAPVTSKRLDKIYSFEYVIRGSAGLEGKIMLDQIRSIDKSRLGRKMGNLSLKEMQEIENILKFVLGIP